MDSGLSTRIDDSLLKEIDKAWSNWDFTRQIEEEVELLWMKSTAELGRAFLPVFARDITWLQQSDYVKECTSICNLKVFVLQKLQKNLKLPERRTILRGKRSSSDRDGSHLPPKTVSRQQKRRSDWKHEEDPTSSHSMVETPRKNGPGFKWRPYKNVDGNSIAAKCGY